MRSCSTLERYSHIVKSTMSEKTHTRTR